ncbi:hypothetical protein ACIBCT_20760 [Streptosporangium sp. NPDC050855]
MARRGPEELGAGCFIAVCVASSLVSLALIGVVIWAVIALVNHVTGG